MSDQTRPDPLGALKAAEVECGAQIPGGLLEKVLALEKDATEQNADRFTIQAKLRAYIEAGAKDST